MPWCAEGTTQTAVIRFKNTDGTVEEGIHPVNSMTVMQAIRNNKRAVRTGPDITIK